jgi:tetratricopeptide (TPR) repeat protein
MTGCRDTGASSHLQPVARAVVVAAEFDRGSRALVDEDDKALLSAYQNLHLIGARTVARQLATSAIDVLVQRANTMAFEASGLHQTQAAQLAVRADNENKLAQQLAGDYAGDDAISLNVVGYMLADKGTSTNDWARAERMTRRAVEILESNRAASRGAAISRYLLLQTALTRDSLAWALFREKRFTEALTQQQKALREWRECGAPTADDTVADLHYHLGEIWLGLGKRANARSEFETAVKCRPGSVLAVNALGRMGNGAAHPE